MPTTQPVSFTSPGFDYGADLASIERKRKLAEALQAQSFEPIQTSSYNGIPAPISWTQGAAKLAQAWASGKQSKYAEEEQRALSTKAQDEYKNMLTSGLNKLQGSPVSEDASGNVTPAQAPDPMGALAAFGSHPMGAQFTPLAMSEISRQRLAESLRGGYKPQQANPMAPGPGASVMAGSGSTVPQSAPQQAGVPGGPAGGQPMELWLQIDPTGKAYAEQLAKDYTEGQKPIADRGYGLKVRNPITGKYDLASNPADITTVERAKLDATEPFKTTNVTQASGAQVPTFNYQLPGYPGTQPPGAQPKPQVAPQPAPRPQPAAPAPQPAAAGDPWTTMPRLQTPQGVGQSTYQHTVQTQQGQTAHALSDKFGTLAASANDRRALGMQALGLIDSADTGPGAARIADIKNLLVSRFSVPESSFANTPSATIALQKDLLNAATQKAKQQFGARMTQSEVMLMLSRGAPNVDMTKAAMKYLINSDLATADYQIKQANDLGRYLQQGGDPMRFEGWYTQSFPLSNALGAVHLPTGKANETAGSTQVIDDLVKKYGSKPR